jgi:hypothetical protein
VSRSPLLHFLPVLRGLAGRFGFESLLAAHVNFDLLGFGFRLFCELDLQHTPV